MRAVLLAALRAAAITAVASPVVFICFGWLTVWPATAPPIGQGNVEWHPEMRPAGTGGMFDPGMSTEGWVLIGLIFLVAFVALMARPSLPTWRPSRAKTISLAVLRAAGLTGLCVPFVWLTFGGVSQWRGDAPPLGLQNIEWPFVPYGTYISFAGWVLLGLIFALALLVRARRPDPPFRPGRARYLDRTLMTIGAGVLAVAVMGAVSSLDTGEYLVDPNCTPGMYIQRLCDDSYYPAPLGSPAGT